MAYAPVYPHDPIEAIGDNVFMARGSIRMNALMRITRNMAIVRDGDALTLVNPVRLNDTELARLDALGTVRHILRTGCFHGIDDPFYMNRYGAEFWSQAGGTTYTEPPIDHVVTTGGELPFGGARVVCFEKTKQPECVVLIERERLLLTCDAIQHYGDYSFNNLPARLLMPLIGFPKTTLLGPLWLKALTPEGASLADEFERLLELDFDRLLAAHGTLLDSGAHDAVRAAVRRAFAD